MVQGLVRCGGKCKGMDHVGVLMGANYLFGCVQLSKGGRGLQTRGRGDGEKKKVRDSNMYLEFERWGGNKIIMVEFLGR